MKIQKKHFNRDLVKLQRIKIMIKTDSLIISLYGLCALILVMFILFVDIPGSTKLMYFVSDAITDTNNQINENTRFLDIRPVILLGWVYFAIMKALVSVNFFKSLGNTISSSNNNLQYLKTKIKVNIKFVSIFIFWICVLYFSFSLIFEL